MLKVYSYPDYSLNSFKTDNWFHNTVDFQDKSVFVKLNLVTPPVPGEEQSCVHPGLIEPIGRSLLKRGARSVIFGDGGFVGKWDVYRELMGLDTIEKRNPGLRIVNVRTGQDALPFVLVRIPDYISLYGMNVSEYVLNSDILLSVAKLKVHSMVRYTGAIKNMMGMMKFKGSMHPGASENILHNRLCDLYSYYRDKVKLSIIDGIIGAEYSECSGIPIYLGRVIISDDMWRADVYGTRLLNMKSESIEYLRLIGHKFGYDFNEEELHPDVSFNVEESPLYQKFPKYRS